MTRNVLLVAFDDNSRVLELRCRRMADESRTNQCISLSIPNIDRVAARAVKRDKAAATFDVVLERGCAPSCQCIAAHVVPDDGIEFPQHRRDNRSALVGLDQRLSVTLRHGAQCGAGSLHWRCVSESGDFFADHAQTRRFASAHDRLAARGRSPPSSSKVPISVLAVV
jgi:hypothetical protein